MSEVSELSPLAPVWSPPAVAAGSLVPEMPMGHGSETVDTQGLKPGPRGTRQCKCRGEVLEMKGNYGWIEAFKDLDHPDAGKHGGHVYVHKRDSRDTLLAGDIVEFYLYADH